VARRVYFHIGGPKTGTTFLQAVMWGNREVLREQGVLFPGDRWLDRVWATNVVRETSNVPHEMARTSWDRIVAQTRAFDGTVVISHEFFAAATREQAARAIADLAPAEVHVVFTARDYVRQVPGLWQEQLKFRLATPLSEYDPEPLTASPASHFSWRTLDVVDALRRWGGDLPPEHVHVVTLPPAGSAPGILWERFATLCGIDPDSCNTDLGRSNESLGAVEAELMRRVNPRISDEIRGPREVPVWVRDYLGHTVLVPRGRERFSVSPQRAHELREKSREAVREIEAAGYDVVGDLKELIPPDDLPSLRQPDEVSEGELLEAALDSMAVMLKNYRDVALERKELRARAVRAEREAEKANARLERAGVSGTVARLRRRARRVLDRVRGAQPRRAR
jgi:hypothetical protein